MLEYDKLYTVEDVAQKTGLTDRTIRNYLKDGRLKGKKIGGQWRFTADDIEALFRTPGEEQSSAAAYVEDLCSQSNPGAYTVVEYLCDQVLAKEIAARIYADMEDSANNYSGCKFDYIYNESRKCASYTLRGSIDFAASAIKIIRKQAKKS